MSSSFYRPPGASPMSSPPPAYQNGSNQQYNGRGGHGRDAVDTAGGGVSKSLTYDQPTQGNEKFRHPSGKIIEIRDVWANNLDEEMACIREIIQKYNYVAMDTEFPGVVARPVGSFNSHTEYTYQTLRCNVDLLRIIQLGLTFADENGDIPEGCACWQFNFQFDLKEDLYAQDSIDLLKRSGIDFDKHQRDGVDVMRFGELLMSSGLVLMPNVKWISFHSGYDFGYLLKLLTCQALPEDEHSFFGLLSRYFPYIYDIKQLMRSVDGLQGGLNRVAEDLGVDRVGPKHQAGSDSLLTSAVFFAMSEKFFQSNVEKRGFTGSLYGLNNPFNQPQ